MLHIKAAKMSHILARSSIVGDTVGITNDTRVFIAIRGQERNTVVEVEGHEDVEEPSTDSDCTRFILASIG